MPAERRLVGFRGAAEFRAQVPFWDGCGVQQPGVPCGSDGSPAFVVRLSFGRRCRIGMCWRPFTGSFGGVMSSVVAPMPSLRRSRARRPVDFGGVTSQRAWSEEGFGMTQQAVDLRVCNRKRR